LKTLTKIKYAVFLRICFPQSAGIQCLETQSFFLHPTGLEHCSPQTVRQYSGVSGKQPFQHQKPSETRVEE